MAQLHTSSRVIDNRLMAIAQGELRDNERIEWSESPDPIRVARKTLPVVLFGIPWTAFALFWIAGASGFKVPDFSQAIGLFPLFGVPFVLIGLAMLSSPLWAAKGARNTAYIVTNQRVMILEARKIRGVSVVSYLPAQLEEIRKVQFADGTGDLFFGKRVSSSSRGGTRMADVGFVGVSDLRAVEDLLIKLTHKGQ